MPKSLANEFCLASIELLDQSMIKIRHCLDQLNEDQVWWRPQPDINSIGNLCIHLAGNLRQWGVVPFSDAEDLREREKEFSSTLDRPKHELLELLEQTVAESSQRWLELDEEQILQSRMVQGFSVTGLHAISHTSSHFVGHTHQMISLTRMQLRDSYRFQWTPEEDRDDLPI